MRWVFWLSFVGAAAGLPALEKMADMTAMLSGATTSIGGLLMYLEVWCSAAADLLMLEAVSTPPSFHCLLFFSFTHAPRGARGG